MSGLGVLRKPFVWKFSYPRFSKKVKYNNEVDLQKSLDETLEVAVEEEDLYWREALAAQLRAAHVLRWHFDEEANDNDEDEKGNHSKSTITKKQLSKRPNSLNLEPPVDVFLGLAGGPEPISPDNNIYEVPPGAIELSLIESSQKNFSGTLSKNSSAGINLEPPAGFGDYHQTIKPAVYATVIKRCRRVRPSLAVMLPCEAPVYANLDDNEIFPSTKMSSATSSTLYANLEPTDGTIYENIPEVWIDKSEITNEKNESNEECLQKQNEEEEEEEILINIPQSENIPSENLNTKITDNNKNELLESKKETSVENNDDPIEKQEDNSDPSLEEALAACIQISDDGTWTAMELPAEEVEEKRKEVENDENENDKSTFLLSNNSEKIKMRQLEKNYGGQFYVPILNSDDEETDPQEAARVRRQVIDSQAVRAKRINSWVKGDDMFHFEEGQEVNEELLQELQAEFGEDINYDSIVQNKLKTKTYWEQLMAAAAAKNSPVKGYHTAPGTSIDTPKVVDATSKSTPESLIVREIRQQRERELAVAREREAAAKKACISSESTPSEDLQLPSINNTDEGNCSEYGSEGKELSLDGTGSRVMSPEVTSQNGLAAHQRTQSLDSMSSGHSSGSGSGSGISPARRRNTVKPYEEVQMDTLQTYSDPAALLMSLQDDQINEDCVPHIHEVMHKIQELQESSEISTSRNLKETPIEREIRLSREREEELRREKLALSRDSSMPSAILNNNDSITPSKLQNFQGIPVKNERRTMQLRLATNRIQQEIDEATEREKELREVGKIQTISIDTVDEKVRRIGESLDFNRDAQDFIKDTPPSPSQAVKPNRFTANKPMQRSVSISQLFFKETAKDAAATWINRTSLNNNKRSSSGQKGLMRKFIASHGKLPGMVTVNGPNVVNPNGATPPSPPSNIHLAQLAVAVNDESEETNTRSTFQRRGYRPAGEMISSELKEMQRREEELRLQRMHQMARSQPNLLFLSEPDGEIQEDKIKPAELESMKSQSNQDLYDDSSEKEFSENLNSRGESMPLHSASKLIGKFETLIKQNNEN